jgi:hypothetical protein
MLTKCVHAGLGLVAVSLVAAVGCGSSDAANSSFDSGADGGANGAGDPNGTTLGGTDTDGGTSSGGNGTGACGAKSTEVAQVPTYLVVMFDRSGSMVSVVKDGEWLEKSTTMWDVSRDALTSFFNDTHGISASLSFFPGLGYEDVSDEGCGLSGGIYVKPTVPMSALPSSTFGQAIARTGPRGGYTPTLGALTGAISQAKQVKLGLKGPANVSVLFVTDGVPQFCGDKVSGSVTAARQAAKDVRTYVVGLGNIDGLDAIALAGGTKRAFQIPVDAPQGVGKALLKALGTVRDDSACMFTLPAEFDPSKPDAVNVSTTAAGGSATPLDYSSTCAGGKGWRYDDAKAPTKILVCPASCTGKVDVQVGCPTRGEPVR